MVKRTLFYTMFFLCLLSGQTFLHAETQVTAQINGSKAVEDNPILVLLTVERDDQQQIDLNSIEMANQPLKVSLVNDSTRVSWSINNGKRSQNRSRISVYRFTLPGAPAGLYVLPAISVKIGGAIYNTQPISYEVIKIATDANFRLVAKYDGEMPLYPGQRTRFYYRIYFQDNIEFTREVLPLLDAVGLKKIGSKKIKEGDEGGVQYQEISQEVEASAPGTYSFGPSILEGYAYQVNWMGAKSYRNPPLRAQVEAIEVVVAPFPEKDKPIGFNGAIGSFQMDVKMTTPPELYVGDKIALEIVFTGKGQFESISPPDLSKFPGFVGMFRFSDLPPFSEINDTSKRYVIEMRPLSTSVDKIPSFSFAFYNPTTRSYEELASQAIPIVVKPASNSSLRKPAVPVKEESPQEKQSPQISSFIAPIEISGNYPLTASDLKRPFWQTPRVFWVVPFGLLLLLAQMGLKRLQSRNKKIEIDNAQKVLDQAVSETGNPTACYALLERALLLRLYEQKVVLEPVAHYTALPHEGIALEVRQFLAGLEERLFSGEMSTVGEDTLTKCKKLFERIHS